MTSNELRELKQSLEQQESNLLGTKGTEYIVSNENRLKFFYDYAKQLDVDPKVVCAIFLMKHINSILNFAKTGVSGSESIDGRINDARNYLLFMSALAHEQKSVDDTPEECSCETELVGE